MTTIAPTLPAPLDALGPDDAEVLAGYLEPLWFEAGTRIFDAGAPGDGCYVIDDGLVRLDMPFDEVDSDGTLAYVEPGEILGELSLLDGLPRSVAATAETDVTARRLAADALDQLVTQHPDVAMVVLRALGRDLAGKLRDTNERLAEHLAVEGRDPEVEGMVAAAKAAAEGVADWDEARIDALLGALSQALGAKAEEFARATVEVTHIGNVGDKTLKNAVAATAIYERLAGQVARGAMGPASAEGVTPVAAPAGVIFGIIPLTNPVATAIYKTISALKGRNALILSFHRVCLPLAEAFDAIVQPVLAEHDAPAALVSCVRARASRQRTARFMSHPDVALVLATGGPGMVRAAYRSGTPAIGVGSGNAPTWVAADADLAAAAGAVVMSKSFDNGLICGAEHNLVVDATVRDAFCEALEAAGAAVLDDDESARFLAGAVTEDGAGFRPEVMGQDAAVLASFFDIKRPHDIRVLVVPGEPDLATPLTSEKIGTFLSLFAVAGDDAALDLCLALISKMGTGHTAIVHTADPARATRFAELMPASRILVNSPGSHGVFGMTTGLEPSLTLGCGTFGGNSTTDNVTWRNLINVKRMATYREG